MLFGNNKYLVVWGKDATEFYNYDNTGQSLGKIGSLSEKVDPNASTISTATLTYDVFNADNVFSAFLYDKLNSTGKMLFNEVIQLYKIGDSGEKVSFFKGYVRSVTPSNAKETSYKITCETVIGKLKTSLWDREFSTYLTETVTEINTNRMATGFVISELIDGGGETYRVINYTGHVLDCMKGMLQMVLSSAVLSSSTMFLDTNYLDFLDTDSFDNVKAELSSDIYNLTFYFEEEISDLFDFLQTQIFQSVGILPSITGEGKLKIALHQQPSVVEGITSLDNSKIIEYSARAIDNDNIINNIVCSYNYDYVEDEYMNSLMRVDVSSFEFFGNELIPDSPETYEFDGLNNLSTASQTSFCNAIMDRMFSRFSREINTLTLYVPIQVGYDIGVGEFVNVEGKSIIDWDTGNRDFESSTVEVVPYVKISSGDSWGGFISVNSVGLAPNGATVITTTVEEIVIEFFKNSSLPSVESNHLYCTDWLTEQGV